MKEVKKRYKDRVRVGRDEVESKFNAGQRALNLI
jgi:hypothetical protein